MICYEIKNDKGKCFTISQDYTHYWATVGFAHYWKGFVKGD